MLENVHLENCINIVERDMATIDKSHGDRNVWEEIGNLRLKLQKIEKNCTFGLEIEINFHLNL